MFGSMLGVVYVGNEVRGVDIRCIFFFLVLLKFNCRWIIICVCLDMGVEGILDGF